MESSSTCSGAESSNMPDKSGALSFRLGKFRTVKPAEARAVYEYLRREGHTSTSFPLTTHPQHLALCDGPEEEIADEEIHHLIPPLFQSYLRAGAKICTEPALDTFLAALTFSS